MERLIYYIGLVLIAIVLISLIVADIFLDASTTKAEEQTSDVFVELARPVAEAPLEPIAEPEDDYIFYDVPLDLETQKEIIEICSEYELSYELVLGVISVESAFIPDIMGDGGDSYGLMQIQPKWWSETMRREGVTDLLDPLQNIRCGCAILRELIDKFDTEYRALQAYNTGRPYTNNGYAEKVYQRMNELTIYGG